MIAVDEKIFAFVSVCQLESIGADSRLWTHETVASIVVVFYYPSAGYGMTRGQTGLYLLSVTTRSGQFMSLCDDTMHASETDPGR